MLVAPNGLRIAKNYELTQKQAQAIVDLEAQCACLDIVIGLGCRRCGDKSVSGSTEKHDDGSLTYRVTCGCSVRSFRGYLVEPPAPGGVRKPRIDLDVKPEVPLSRAQMRVFQDAAEALHQLQLVYAMRCLACRLEDRLRDGCWGAAESNASQFVIECACTKRIYRGSDVKAES